MYLKGYETKVLLLPNFQGYEQKGAWRKCQGTEIFSFFSEKYDESLFSQSAEETKENKNNVHAITTPRHKKKKKSRKK